MLKKLPLVVLSGLTLAVSPASAQPKAQKVQKKAPKVSQKKPPTISDSARTSSASPTDAPVSATSTSSAPDSGLSSLREKIRLSAVYDGQTAALSNIASAEAPSVSSAHSGSATPHRLFVNMAYQLSPQMTLTPTLGALANGSVEATPGRVVLDTPYITLAHNSLVKEGNYNLAGQVRSYLPLSESFRSKNLLNVVRVTQIQSYALTGTPWALGLASYLQGYFYSQATSNSPRLKTYLSPSANYQLKQNVAIGVLYEMAASQTQGMNWNGFSSTGTDLEPYLNWDINPALNLNAYLDLKTGGRISASTTQIGATLTWRLL
jgi:hypothetical protein